MSETLINSVVALIVGVISYFAGRKTNIDKLKIKADIKKTEFEALQAELTALRDFRNLLISDNESMLKELKSVKAEQIELKEEIVMLRALVASMSEASKKTNTIVRKKNI